MPGYLTPGNILVIVAIATASHILLKPLYRLVDNAFTMEG